MATIWYRNLTEICYLVSDIKPALVQIVARRRAGAKPFPERMVASTYLRMYASLGLDNFWHCGIVLYIVIPRLFRPTFHHNGAVTWVPPRLKSMESRLLVQWLFKVNNTESQSSSLLTVCEGNPQVTDRFPSQKANNTWSIFFIITSSRLVYFTWSEYIIHKVKRNFIKFCKFIPGPTRIVELFFADRVYKARDRAALIMYISKESRLLQCMWTFYRKAKNSLAITGTKVQAKLG